MQAGNARVFEDKAAVREATPLLLGIIGPSGGGKTFSALRLATGIQSVVGGDIWGIDTESRRMLHYADRFKFRHVQFGAPFASLDYLAAIEHCVRKGAKTIIVDSMSHEHEGPGGVLEQHAIETKRLAALWKCSEDKAQMSAWAGPKQDRRRMINTILQINANIIFCFRAKEKMKLGSGKPTEMGFMPIAGEEFVYEMVLKCLLLPSANGVPTWKSDYPGEKMMMKLPEQFKDMFEKDPQLDEGIGAKLAQWAAGSPKAEKRQPPTKADYDNCEDADLLAKLEERRIEQWKQVPTAEKPTLKAASLLATLRTSPSKETLEKAWSDTCDWCTKTDLDIPDAHQAAYAERGAALGETGQQS
jgi:ABC-type dipeptide/oligopeptide/nickel transport system ATPase subunit